MPWKKHPSIFEHVKAHIKPGTTGLDEAGRELPDEERLAGPGEIRWSAGAMDGVLTHHWGGADAESKKDAEAILAQIVEYCEKPTAEKQLKLYETVREKKAVVLVDPILKGLVANEKMDQQRLYDLARFFATESSDREPVKLGIAMLGIYRAAADKELFRTLGRHDEFTLYCVVAMANALEKPEPEIWELAKQVDGWGRVFAVEKLADTKDAQIKEWLLREGYKNSVMYEYIAYTCAQTGGLLNALNRDQVDDPLLHSAGELIQALLAGGPALDINNYDDGTSAIECFLRHMDTRASGLSDFLTISAIKAFVSDKEADRKHRVQLGWTPEKRKECTTHCTMLLERPHWRQLTLECLDSNDEAVFHSASQVAEVLHIDPWKWHWKRLQQAPRKSTRWFYVMKHCNEPRIDEVVVFAEKALPLHEIATGPAKESGLGNQFELHNCLGSVLQELNRFPGHGYSLIATGLKSPVVRNRNMALEALSAWGEAKWPDGTKEQLKSALEKEPDEKVRKRIEEVIAGKPREKKPVGDDDK